MEIPRPEPKQQKGCIITLMFPVEDDKFALEIKSRIDECIKDIPDKRFTFQINET